MSIRLLRMGLAAFGAALIAGAAPAHAQQDNPFSALVGKSREPAEERARANNVERYVLTTDDRMFLFEERDSSARVQFLCNDR